ncbi:MULTISPECIES: glycosyltransferase family 8 protein [unclassified Leptolyngbya]|uniref:glycosyltransferase family 8 protein n=1 Tax=unclassified Leptolyngbya TaxID=2650499 RepID=UPI001ACF5244|nr:MULTISPECIES: glycosyltransferase family 8 protein [unclassified Leptolyngbya]MBN8559308.1 glycosyltransferase family 8 protein [Leptolyngbya sp. UWPOB_LEPTO1]MCY6489303.1 glycosyltransferase family 8 protein [Leptolyngbya sp. GGD]
MHLSTLPSPINIVCTIDNHYAQHCAVMLASLFHHNPKRQFRVFLITDGLEMSIWERLEQFLQDQKQEYELIQIDRTALGDAPVTHHISLATYFRLFIPEVLPQTLQKVLFLDVDMIVRKSIDELWDKDIHAFSHAATIAAGMDEYPEQIGLPRNSLYFNAGLLLINLEAWRNLRVFDRGCEIIRQSSDRITWWDQDVLNILLHDHWMPLDLLWNAQPFLYSEEFHQRPQALYKLFQSATAIAEPAIVHFVGGGSAKPWHFYCTHPFKDDYRKFLKKTPWQNTPLICQPDLVTQMRFRLGLGSKARKLLRGSSI